MFKRGFGKDVTSANATKHMVAVLGIAGILALSGCPGGRGGGQGLFTPSRGVQPAGTAPVPSPTPTLPGWCSTVGNMQVGSVCPSASSTPNAAPAGQSSAAPSGGSSASCSPPLPSTVVTGAQTTVSAQITGYGWPDNDPPGGAVSNPILHQTAGGTGTYCDPITFATEPSEDATFPYGTMIYVPNVHRYFIREDDCEASGPTVNSGNNGCTGIWFDLWIGGTGSDSTSAVGDCENAITQSNVQVIVNPPSGLAVTSGPVFNNGACNP